MPNSWYKQAYLQGFDCEPIAFKKAVNMFEPMFVVLSVSGPVCHAQFMRW